MIRKWFQKIGQWSGFGTAPQQPPESKIAPGIKSASPSPDKTGTLTTPHLARHSPYLLVIGLDFGTAFTKVIFRDGIVTDPGKAYPVSFTLSDGRSTCLFPSVVFEKEGALFTALDNVPTGSSRIEYLKMRLVAAAEKKRAEAWADYQGAHPLQVIVAWFLASVLATAGTRMRKIWPDYGQHQEDYCFVNIGVPIDHADSSPVEQELLTCLRAAYAAVGPAGTNTPSPETIADLLNTHASIRKAKEYCYSYPETSANLQSYLKSRGRNPGLYLLLDVGAGTVDLSFFRLCYDFIKTPLLYYHAKVFDSGSSRLELLAAQHNNTISLEDARRYKENPHQFFQNSTALEKAFDAARKKIYEETVEGVGKGLTATEPKMHPDRRMQLKQMKEIRLFFSGGGFTKYPYENAVRYFQEKRQWSHQAPIEKIPTPSDIDWRNTGERENFHRLAVAYGLSFPQYRLESQKFPSETWVNIDAPPPETRDLPEAPTKDEV